MQESNYINLLQEKTAKLMDPTKPPVYSMIEKEGPPHKPEIRASVQLANGSNYTSVKAWSTYGGAKQDAALVALHDLERHKKRLDIIFDTMMTTVEQTIHALLNNTDVYVHCENVTMNEIQTFCLILNMMYVNPSVNNSIVYCHL